MSFTLDELHTIASLFSIIILTGLGAAALYYLIIILKRIDTMCNNLEESTEEIRSISEEFGEKLHFFMNHTETLVQGALSLFQLYTSRTGKRPSIRSKK